MRSWVALLVASIPGWACADHEAAVRRALIQRDQQSAEFAAQLKGPQARRTMEDLHARQLVEAATPLSAPPRIAEPLRSAQRASMAQESVHVLSFAPPVQRS